MAYRQIAKGVQLKIDHDNYITWLNKSTGDRQAAYAAITPKAKVIATRTPGFIIPFGVSVSSKVYLPREVLSQEQASGGNSTIASALVGALKAAGTSVASTDRIFYTFPYGTTGSPAVDAGFQLAVKKDFKFASVSLKIVTAKAEKLTPSRITQRQYKRNVSGTVTAHFGQVPASGDTYATAVSEITAALKATSVVSTNTNGYSIRFKPEGS